MKLEKLIDYRIKEKAKQTQHKIYAHEDETNKNIEQNIHVYGRKM